MICRLSAVAVLVIAGCAELSEPARPARQWQEGDTIYYDDGHYFQVSVSVAMPHYRLGSRGDYVPTDEEKGTHYHLLRNPKGPPGQYVRCFATRRPDGTWEHKPQWHELDPKWRLRGEYRGD